MSKFMKVSHSHKVIAMDPTTSTTSSRIKKPLLQSGMVLNGKWEILQHLATGGKGEVYRASQCNLNREVVVKTVSTEYLAEFGDDQTEIETEIERFHREALAMARIRHPYVVQVYDQDAATIVKRDEELRVHYVVMEFVPGARTLRNTMPSKGFQDRESDLREWIRTYFLPMFGGLETVHALGIVHRDMKPENVLLDGSTPKITDFGIAGGTVWSQITRSHHVEGTITYMAPEQFMDLAESDGRVDVYALGKILYEAVQGKMVDSKTACPLKGVCLSNPSTPFLKELDLIVQQATAEDKEKRTPSVKALREQLERLLEKAEASERPLLKGLHRKQIIAILGMLFIIVAVSNVYHHLIMTHEPSMPSHNSQSTEEEKSTSPEVMTSKQEARVSTLEAKGGSTMHLVPAGQVRFPRYAGTEGGKLIDVPKFYLDETEVTNYKYVEFLNQTLSKVQVKDGVVLSDGKPWLMLGPVYGGYEPIVFRSGRFSLQDAAAASRPVVKVTGYGAAAYAAFSGERLPTEAEWLRAAGRKEATSKTQREESAAPPRGTANLETEMEAWVSAFKQGNAASGNASTRQRKQESPKTEEKPDAANQGPSSVPYPVLSFAPNPDGIRGLTSNVSEWGVRPGLSPTSEPQFVVLGGLRGTMLEGGTPFPGIAQDPAMAFEDVGFRCARTFEAKVH